MPILVAIYNLALQKPMPPDAQPGDTSLSKRCKQRLKLGGLKLLCLLRGATQAAADSVTKKLFLAAYEASDDAYWRRHASQCEWRSLGGIIEYTPNLLAVPSKRAGPVYLIAIRAAAKTDLERVTIELKAKKAGVIYVQQITQDRLCTVPVRKSLAAIPLKPRSSKGVDWLRLGDLYIKLTKAVDHNATDLVRGQKISQIFPSTGADSPSFNQVERWGQFWNIDAINVERENIKARYYRQLVQSVKHLGRPLTIRRAAYRLLSSQVGVSLAFWAENLGSAEGIRHSIAQAEAKDRPIRSAENATATAS